MSKIFDNATKITREQVIDLLYGSNQTEIRKERYITEMYFDKDFMNTVRKKFPLADYTTKHFFRKNEIHYFLRSQDIRFYIEHIASMKAIHESIWH